MSSGLLLRGKFQDRANRVSTREECTEFLENLSLSLDRLYVENIDTVDFVSAMSGFLEDYAQSDKMTTSEFKRLCEIVLESLFYE